ncbi:MAG: succinate dehydrogenase cytochrome b subunit [Bryobacteraceae bacterium]
MTATALNRPLNFFAATIGKKVVMAVTGVILFGFVIGHLLGNLQVFLGREKLDAYAESLRHLGGLLWIARGVLLLSVILHIVSSIQLAMQKNAARPVAYTKKESVASSYASRTMMWSGPIVAVFIVYHLLHFTIGAVHPNFVDGHVYDNVVSGFSSIPVSLFYIVAMVLLGQHLYHGAWSMFQTLGVGHPRYSTRLRTVAAALAALIVIGNVSMPVAVLLGIVK